jgi:hypothetical protein
MKERQDFEAIRAQAASMLLDAANKLMGLQAEVRKAQSFEEFAGAVKKASDQFTVGMMGWSALLSTIAQKRGG